MKKQLIAFVITIISSLSLFAQIEATTKVEKSVDLECSELISIETDKMTGKSTTAAKKTLIISDDGGKSGFGIFLMVG